MNEQLVMDLAENITWMVFFCLISGLLIGWYATFTYYRQKEPEEKPNDKPSWEEVTDKMETSKESIKEVIEREKRHDDELRDLFDRQSLRQIDHKAMFYKYDGLTTEQFEQATHNYLRRMGFTKDRLEHLGYGHLVRLL